MYIYARIFNKSLNATYIDSNQLIVTWSKNNITPYIPWTENHILTQYLKPPYPLQHTITPAYVHKNGLIKRWDLYPWTSKCWRIRYTHIRLRFLTKKNQHKTNQQINRAYQSIKQIIVYQSSQEMCIKQHVIWTRIETPYINL